MMSQRAWFRRTIFVMAFCALTGSSSSVFAAADGNGTSGGGNSLQGQMIEQYLVVDPEAEIPNLKELLGEFTARLRQAIPELADAVNAVVQDQDWYLIPQRIRQLPESVTGLQFESDQVAYQNGREIFLDQTELALMTRDQQALLYKHETLMAVLHYPAESIRAILAFMRKRPNFTGKELREKIGMVSPSQSLFYMATREEQNLIRQTIEAANQQMRPVCQSRISDPDKLKKREQIAMDALNKWVATSENDWMTDLYRYLWQNEAAKTPWGRQFDSLNDFCVAIGAGK